MVQRAGRAGERPGVAGVGGQGSSRRADPPGAGGSRAASLRSRRWRGRLRRFSASPPLARREPAGGGCPQRGECRRRGLPEEGMRGRGGRAG